MQTPPRLSLTTLDPHLALLRPPGLLIRRDTARIADAHPALPCACSVSAGYGSREATRICPSPAEGETDRAAEEGWEPLGWTEDGRTWGELDADEGADLGRDSHPDAEAPACARCCGTGQEIDLSSGELRDCRACHGTGSEIDLSEADPTCPYCGRPGLAARGGICADCYPGAEGPEDEDCENPEDWQDEDWTGHPDLGAGALRADDPAACSACRGSGQELRADGSGELDSCEDCGGTGLAEPWRDPDYAAARGLCPGCGIDLRLSPEAGSCATCDARVEAGTGEDDDPDPGDGGLGLPSLQARGWAAEVEAEACPGCGRPSPHLYAGATCAGCLVGRAA